MDFATCLSIIKFKRDFKSFINIVIAVFQVMNYLLFLIYNDVMSKSRNR